MKTKEAKKLFSVVTFLVIIFLLTDFALALPGISGKSSSSSPEKLKQEAQDYMQKKEYPKTEQIYKTIMTEWPNSDHAFEAQASLAVCYILQGEDVKAEAATNTLMADYAKHPEIAGAINLIADNYRITKTGRAIELYQYILKKYPSYSRAMLTQSDLAVCYILQNEDVKAKAATDTLLANYANHPDIAGGIKSIANNYRMTNTGRSIELYQYILKKHPSPRWDVWAQSGLAFCYILQNEDVKAEAATNTLMSDYANHPDIAGAIKEVASGYCKTNTGRAIELYQYILKKHPSYSQAMLVQSGLAVCYILQGEDVKAKAATDTLLADYANHAGIVKEIEGIANNYRITNTGRSIELYQYILKKYSSHSRGMWSQSGLAVCYILQNEGVKAEAATNTLLADYANHPDIAKGIEDVAKNYRKTNTGRAMELYQHILKKYPSCSRGMWIQSDLAVCYIFQGKGVKAEAAIDMLLADYANHPGIAGRIKGIASHYRKTNTDRAIELYQYVLKQPPSHSWDMWSQSGLAVCYIFQGEGVKAETAIDTLLADYAKSPEIVKGIEDVANYCRITNTGRAMELYQHILKKYPSHNRAMWSQSGLAVCYILQGEDVKAEAATDTLMADYSNHPGIVKGIENIADSYRKRNTGRAIELYQYILKKYPSYGRAIWVQSGLAFCYIQQSEDVKAEAAIDTLMADYANHPDIVRCIRKIAAIYKVTDTVRAIELYQYMLKKDPSYSLAMWARSGLLSCYILQDRNSTTEVTIEGFETTVEELMAGYIDHSSLAGEIDRTIQELRESGKIDIVRDILDKWMRDKTSLQTKKTAMLFYINHFDNKTIIDALNRFMAKLRKSPDSINIINKIAEKCYESDKNEIAVKLYQIYLKDHALEADKEKIKLKLYESMYLAGMDIEKVLASLEEDIKKNRITDINLKVKALVLKGQILVKLGEVDKAIDQFLMIKKQYPQIKEYPEANFFIGYCYMLQGKFEQAKDALNLMVKEYPKSIYAEKSQLYLTRIRSMAQ